MVSWRAAGVLPRFSATFTFGTGPPPVAAGPRTPPAEAKDRLDEPGSLPRRGLLSPLAAACPAVPPAPRESGYCDGRTGKLRPLPPAETPRILAGQVSDGMARRCAARLRAAAAEARWLSLGAAGP